ncbi:MAG: PQQ-like beta-propeller repeat protein [Planctomycetales bacterium]|nr:PQQ-like beta-propeller repeat protein [Planctomycetales bacterium]
MRLSIASLLITFFLATPSCWAQLSESEVQALGFESAWRSKLQIPRVGRGIVSANLWVESAKPRRFAVVQLPDRVIRVSADSLDRDGKPIGIEAAKKMAGEQASIFLGKPGSTVEEIEIPQIKLVVAASDGLVQTLDAETGKLIWSNSCGHTNAPAFPAAVSPLGVTLVQGRMLYLLDWATGKQLQTHPLRSSTSNAVSVCNDIAFVSDYTGTISTYDLGSRHLPWTYVMSGRAVGHPVNFAGQEFCATSTDRGYTYVFSGSEEPKVWFRYETPSAITGSLSAGNNAFYVGSTGGVIAKISADSRLGSIVWEFRSGQPITAPSLVVGNSVYVATENGDVIAIDDATGNVRWDASGYAVSTVIARAGKQLVCRTKSDQTLILDADSGAYRALSDSTPLSGPIMNQTSDRVYLAGVDGRIQCLRTVGAELPTLVVPFTPAEDTDENSVETTAASASTPTNNASSIFGTEAADPMNIFETDPLGGGSVDNPFETPPASDTPPAADNPFDF